MLSNPEEVSFLNFSTTDMISLSEIGCKNIEEGQGFERYFT